MSSFERSLNVLLGMLLERCHIKERVRICSFRSESCGFDDRGRRQRLRHKFWCVPAVYIRRQVHRGRLTCGRAANSPRMAKVGDRLRGVPSQDFNSSFSDRIFVATLYVSDSEKIMRYTDEVSGCAPRSCRRLLGTPWIAARHDPLCLCVDPCHNREQLWNCASGRSTWAYCLASNRTLPCRILTAFTRVCGGSCTSLAIVGC